MIPPSSNSQSISSAEALYKMGSETIHELETEKGILASGRQEIFGCIFGRDSLISALQLLYAYEKNKDAYFIGLVRKILVNLFDLQGTSVNIESGEEPGKCIHEYRPEKHEHLTKRAQNPWFVYPDSIMRNYDSLDSTPLLLIAIFRYYQATGDEQFLEIALPHVHTALDWIVQYGDSNKDGFLDYGLRSDREYGGLEVQNWMDSKESVFHEDGTQIAFPIAPIEVQAYTYAALKSWGSYFYKSADNSYGVSLLEKAKALKHNFNDKFFIKEGDRLIIANGIDGNGKPMLSARSSMGHCLWATVKTENGLDSIVNKEYISLIAQRLMASDLFIPGAGIRTLSTQSRNFLPNSYHNGSIWPHDNAMIIEGLHNFNFIAEARQVKESMLSAWSYFNTPIELFVYDNGFKEYISETGQTACKQQAWSAASLLAVV